MPGFNKVEHEVIYSWTCGGQRKTLMYPRTGVLMRSYGEGEDTVTSHRPREQILHRVSSAPQGPNISATRYWKAQNSEPLAWQQASVPSQEKNKTKQNCPVKSISILSETERLPSLPKMLPLCKQHKTWFSTRVTDPLTPF